NCEEARARVGKSLEDAGWRRPDPAAAAGHEPHRAAGDKAIKPLEIPVIFQRNVMMHCDVAFTQPFGGAGGKRYATTVNSHKSAVIRRVDREPDFLGGIEAARSRTIPQEQKLVRLSNCLASPIRGPLVHKIKDQIILAFDRIQPVYDRGMIKLQMWKAPLDIHGCKKETFSRLRKGGSQTVKKFGQNAILSGWNDGYCPRR